MEILIYSPTLGGVCIYKFPTVPTPEILNPDNQIGFANMSLKHCENFYKKVETLELFENVFKATK